MGTFKQGWGASGAPSGFSAILSSLPTSTTAGKQSASIDLTALGNVEDIQVSFRFKLANGGTLASDKAVYLYIFGSIDGTNWPKGNGNTVTGTNTSLTMTGIPCNPIGIDVSGYTTGADRFFEIHGISICQLFGGSLPMKISFGVQNNTGIAFTGSTTDHVVKFVPIYTIVG